MMNPFGLLIALGLAVTPFWVGLDAVRKRDTFFRAYTAAEGFFARSPWIGAVAAVVVVLNWAWNIAKGL
jgi:hypothetical protein